MGDEIARLHRLNVEKELYSKSLFMTWKICNYEAALDILRKFDSLPFETRDDIRQEWLGAGNRMHDFADELHDLVPEIRFELTSVVKKKQIQDVFYQYIDFEHFPRYQWNSIRNIVEWESKNWYQCMQKVKGSIDDVMWYFNVPYREVYVENRPMKMALNIDRMQRIPGSPNEFAMIEFKKNVKDNINKELAWYSVGAFPNQLFEWIEDPLPFPDIPDWSEQQHYCREAYPVYDKSGSRPSLSYVCDKGEKCDEIGIKISKWGAVGYDFMESTRYGKIYKVSIRNFLKDYFCFLDDMNLLKDDLLNYELIKPRRIMPKSPNGNIPLMCKFCDFQRHCMKPLIAYEMFDIPDVEPWEHRRREQHERRTKKRTD